MSKYQVKQCLSPKLAPLTGAVSAILTAGTVQASTITVTNLSDELPSGGCSLREALLASQTNQAVYGCAAGEAGTDYILFDAALTGTLQLDGSALMVGGGVVIDGDERVLVRGAGNHPVFSVGTQGSSDPVEFRNLTITNGFAYAGGGIGSSNPNLTLRNVILADNQALIGGGGLLMLVDAGWPGSLSIIDSVITGNEADNGVGVGGGVMVYAEDQLAIELRDNFIKYNQAATGGGVYIIQRSFYNADEPLFPPPITLENNTFRANETSGKSSYAEPYQGSGGGVAILSDPLTPLIVRGNRFVDNSASEHGGGIWSLGLVGSLYDSVLQMEGNLFDGNYAGHDGGGAWMTVNLSGGDVADTGVPDVIAQGNVFRDNQAQLQGGGLLLFTRSPTPIEIDDIHFENNVAGLNGGGASLELDESVVSLSKVELINNQAEAGGGLFITGGDGFYIEDMNVEGNESSASGGGVKLDTAGFVLLEGSRFLDNSAGSCGGGVSLSGESPFISMTESIFRSNVSSDCGGALAISGSASVDAGILISSSEFSGNASGGGLGGGAILADFESNSTMFLFNSTLSGNTSGTLGGGLKVEGSTLSLSVAYSTFAYNHAGVRGGGIDVAVPGCIVGNTLFAANTFGVDEEPQELHAPGCPVRNSLLSDFKYSEFEPDGNVIVDVDPMILPLADNGGSNGLTHALQPGSPAIDAGIAGGLAPQFDQRGAPYSRVFGSALDIGAYELLLDGLFSDRFEN